MHAPIAPSKLILHHILHYKTQMLSTMKFSLTLFSHTSPTADQFSGSILTPVKFSDTLKFSIIVKNNSNQTV